MGLPKAELLKHRSFPELAGALRSGVEAIAGEWDQLLRQARPDVDRLTTKELRDSLLEILSAMADALASPNPEDIRALVELSPQQGLKRFHQQYGVVELMEEDRLLRGILVENVERTLARRMSVPEAAALHAAIDVMLLHSVLAMVESQKAELRAAMEVEVKYLSFLSHDLNNNLNGVSMSLELLRQSLAREPAFAEELETLDLAHQAIADTVSGMRRLLQHERLRKSGAEPVRHPVRLRELAADVVGRFEQEAAEKGLELKVQIPPEMVILSDKEMLALVLQNLVGNAVKYSERGTVEIGVKDRTIWVSDQGPGISPERQKDLFQAFRRGATHGQAGVGLGLAIASQATRLLGGELSVESELGKGSRFSLALPPSAGQS